jgi:hypothetical protein
MGILDGNVIPFIEDPVFLLTRLIWVMAMQMRSRYQTWGTICITARRKPSLLSHKRWPTGIVFLVYLARWHGAGLEEKQHRLHHLHSLSHHIHMRQVGHHGIVQAPTNGHSKPQGVGPTTPAAVGSHTSHDIRPRLEIWAPSLSS